MAFVSDANMSVFGTTQGFEDAMLHGGRLWVLLLLE